MLKYNLVNEVFYRLLVLRRYKRKRTGTFWFCKCNCGKFVIVESSKLLTGNTKSCGCLKKEQLAIRMKKHGLTKTRFYRIWANMKQRCEDPNFQGYKNYGGRGIKVCERWLDFNNFRDDMYESYLKHVEKFGEKNTTISRNNIHGHYEFLNCSWATKKEQQQDTRNSSKPLNYIEHNYWQRILQTTVNNIFYVKFKSGKLFKTYVGCTIQEFKQYIESQFTEGMTWDNHGNGVGKWQFDHIIGCNNFDLSKEEDRKKCFNYKNFQPLWWEDHKKKSRRRILEV